MSPPPLGTMLMGSTNVYVYTLLFDQSSLRGTSRNGWTLEELKLIIRDKLEKDI